MFIIKTSTLVINLHLEPRCIESKLDPHQLLRIELISMSDGIDEDLSDSHFDEVGVI